MATRQRGGNVQGEETAAEARPTVRRPRRENTSQEMAREIARTLPTTTGWRALPNVPSPLSTRLTRMRVEDWGALTPRRLQRLGFYLHTLRETAGESMDAAARAADQHGAAQSSQKTIWNLEQLMDAKIASLRQSVNMLLVAYLVERWGSSLGATWAFMTAEEDVGAAVSSSAQSAEAAAQQAAARDLADLYLQLARRDPERARELLHYAEYITSSD